MHQASETEAGVAPVESSRVSSFATGILHLPILLSPPAVGYYSQDSVQMQVSGTSGHATANWLLELLQKGASWTEGQLVPMQLQSTTTILCSSISPPGHSNFGSASSPWMARALALCCTCEHVSLVSAPLVLGLVLVLAQLTPRTDVAS